MSKLLEKEPPPMGSCHVVLVYYMKEIMCGGYDFAFLRANIEIGRCQLHQTHR